MVLPFSLIKSLSQGNQITHSLDTNGIPYDQVTEQTGFKLSRYECPLLQPGEIAAGGWVGGCVGRDTTNSTSIITTHGVDGSKEKEEREEGGICGL